MRTVDRQIETLRAQQASAWVSALAKPNHDSDAAFVAWLKESPLNVREFLLAHSIEQSLDQLDNKHHVDVDALLAQINPRVAPIRPLEFVPESILPAPRKTWYKIAAGIATIGLIGGGVWFARQSTPQEFRTETGEQRALQLKDGSIVHLNAHTRIAVDFSVQTRDIRLFEGEALFEVHHDERRPFRVLTHDAVIRDVGTRFNVHSRADSVKVAVIEGSVELTAIASVHPRASTGTKLEEVTIAKRPAPRVISADQEAQVDRDGVVTVVTLPDISEATAWWQRRLVYRKETLAHIVEDFNRYNRRHIRLEGEEVKKRSYTGVFDADDPDSLAEVLANDPELLVDRQTDDIVVVRAR